MLAWVGLLLSAQASVAADTQEQYREPADVIVTAFDAEELPQIAVSPDREWIVRAHWSGPPRIAERARPRITMSRRSFDPRTGAPAGTKDVRALTLMRVSDGASWKLDAPPEGLSTPLWAPDSRHFVFRHESAEGVALWVADVHAHSARALTKPVLNMAHSFDRYPPYTWMPDSRRLLAQLIPVGRGAPPVRPPVSPAPMVAETAGPPSQVKPYGGNLQDAHDEALYEYYMTSQAAIIDIADGAQALVGKPRIYDALSPSPNGRYILSTYIVRPYSHFEADALFPMITEILTVSGERVRIVDERGPGRGAGSATSVASTFPGARRFAWVPSAAATLSYIEALDGGDGRRRATHRDRLLMLAAPFSGEPVELIRTQGRLPTYAPQVRYYSGREYGNVSWLGSGAALVEEVDTAAARKRVWLVDTRRRAAKPRLLWETDAEDRGASRDPLLTRGRGAWSSLSGVEEPIVRQDGDWIYLVGRGGSPEGDRPLLERLNIVTGHSEPLFRAAGGSYEEPLAVLDRGQLVLILHESPEEYPNYFIVDLERGTRRPVTSLSSPVLVQSKPQVQLVHYVRDDGLPLQGTLYLPAGYRVGQRVPTVIWAYPVELVNAAAASQPGGSPNHYPGYGGSLFAAIPFALSSQGYAVLWYASMPVLGGAKANDTAVQQLTANASAAVDKLVDMGIADRRRVAIAGHSYGGLMVATLLAHSDLFAAGVAIDGVYNLTNSPLGFQNEARSLWEAPDPYLQLSAIVHADKITAPLLIVHGVDDDNFAANPADAQRLFLALQGLGRRARLVMLPHEGHQPRARESVLHTLWEMLSWLDRSLEVEGEPVSGPAATAYITP